MWWSGFLPEGADGASWGAVLEEELRDLQRVQQQEAASQANVSEKNEPRPYYKKNINPKPQTSDLQRVQQRGAASQANVRIFVCVYVHQ